MGAFPTKRKVPDKGRRTKDQVQLAQTPPRSPAIVPGRRGRPHGPPTPKGGRMTRTCWRTMASLLALSVGGIVVWAEGPSEKQAGAPKPPCPGCQRAVAAADPAGT